MRRKARKESYAVALILDTINDLVFGLFDWLRREPRAPKLPGLSQYPKSRRWR